MKTAGQQRIKCNIQESFGYITVIYDLPACKCHFEAHETNKLNVGMVKTCLTEQGGEERRD